MRLGFTCWPAGLIIGNGCVRQVRLNVLAIVNAKFFKLTLINQNVSVHFYELNKRSVYFGKENRNSKRCFQQTH